MTWREYIESMKTKWIGRRVEWDGMPYTVVDVDYNGGLLIDMPAQFTDTTSVPAHKVKMLA